MLIQCSNINVKSTFVCQRWINVFFFSFYSGFKFRYIFNIISTYIVNVESTLNQQTCARWVNSHRIFKRLAKALIRLCVYAGWSEALLVAHTTLLRLKSYLSEKIKFNFSVYILLISVISFSIKFIIKEWSAKNGSDAKIDKYSDICHDIMYSILTTLTNLSMK